MYLISFFKGVESSQVYYFRQVDLPRVGNI